MPLYGEDRHDPVGRLLAEDFLGDPTTVAPVATDGLWTLVLTPARVQLPSEADGAAPAQSAGWIRSDALEDGVGLDAKVAVSVSEQTLTITRGEQSVVYDIGVGTAVAPTPTDEPYQGDGGGLIGAHYSDTAAGSVSHGCLRLTHAAVAALNQLPLGTPVTIYG